MSTIRLGQFLKLAGVVESGGQGNMLISEGDVRVNGQVVTQRGKQLSPGDRVTVDSPQGKVEVQVELT